MDFELTAEQKLTQKGAREFAEKAVQPLADELDDIEEFPWDLVRQAGELGMMGITIPDEYGGGGLDTICYCILEEEIACVWASLGLIISANNSLSCAPIFEHGNEDQKKKYLTPLVQGKTLGCYALTEPEAGSDAASLVTTAELKGEEWIINGKKILITNGSVADVCVLIARTGEERHKGLSAFIVETNRPGFFVGKVERKMGLKSSPTAELLFENCRIPKENLLGKEGEGWKVAMQTLDGGRINIAAQAIGIARASLEASIKYAKQRVQFGRPIAEFQATKFKLAEIASEIDAARLLMYRAAFLKDKEVKFSKEASMAKLKASEIAVRASREAVQIYGGYGYMKDYPVERYYRDAKATEIYEGTSEIQKEVIAGDLLKLK